MAEADRTPYEITEDGFPYTAANPLPTGEMRVRYTHSSTRPPPFERSRPRAATSEPTFLVTHLQPQHHLQLSLREGTSQGALGPQLDLLAGSSVAAQSSIWGLTTGVFQAVYGLMPANEAGSKHREGMLG